MKTRSLVGSVLAVALAPWAHAQFQVYQLEGNSERLAQAITPLGSTPGSDTLTGNFRIRNMSRAAAQLTYLEVKGPGFTLSSGPFLPTPVAPQVAFDFTVTFSAADPGAYSAILRADGVSLLLTATVVPSLTYTADTPAGKQTLGSPPVDFGSADIGKAASLHFSIENRATQSLTAPSILLAGGDFVLQGAPTPGTALVPGAAAGFDIQFRPSAAGKRNGTLVIGSRSFTLTGTGTEPVMPQPRVTIDLPQPHSGQQGSASVKLEDAAPIATSGTLTLLFQPAVSGASDGGIVFASGGTSASFTLSAGDTVARFAGQTAALFQTGTTAGTLVFTVQLRGLTDQQSVTLSPAIIGVTSTQASRTNGSIEVQIAGFDNTRTAGALSFTFYDAAGQPVSPGVLRADAGSVFGSYFQGSANLGGAFLLRALFPVAGDSSRIASFEASLSNSAGTATTARRSF